MLAMIMMAVAVVVVVVATAAMVTATHPHLRILMTPRNLEPRLLNKMVAIQVVVHRHQVDYLQEPLLVLPYPVVLLFMQWARCL